MNVAKFMSPPTPQAITTLATVTKTAPPPLEIIDIYKNYILAVVSASFNKRKIIIFFIESCFLS